MKRHAKAGRVVSALTVLLLCLNGCGYHTSAHAVRLPSNIHTLYVPTFVNMTQTYRIEQTLTQAVVQELHGRTNYRVVTQNSGEADATLLGTVTGLSTGALTYDSVNGRVSSSVVYIGIKASLVNNKGKTIWENPNIVFREQYQVSTDPASFFSEEGPALQRVATDFSHLLVSDMLEAY